MSLLTIENFVFRIKEMSAPERNLIPIKELVDIIIQLPDNVGSKSDEIIHSLEQQVLTLSNSVNLIRQQSSLNSAEITNLKTKTASNEEKVDACVTDINHLKNLNVNFYDVELKALKDSINEIEQYLRANNIEVVGLPDPNVDEYNEDLILGAINSLQGLEREICPEDIDISHPLPSRRRDQKRVSVVRFLQRKVKFEILEAKKSNENRSLKYRDSEIYLNEHLSPTNRAIFAKASQKKKDLNYKFLWTKNGVSHMRKTEESEVLAFRNEDEIESLAN